MVEITWLASDFWFEAASSITSVLLRAIWAFSCNLDPQNIDSVFLLWMWQWPPSEFSCNPEVETFRKCWLIHRHGNPSRILALFQNFIVALTVFFSDQATSGTGSQSCGRGSQLWPTQGQFLTWPLTHQERLLLNMFWMTWVVTQFDLTLCKWGL